MNRLVFIDDDRSELDEFEAIVGTVYEYEPVEWPREEAKLFSTPAPSIYVSDLYLPPSSGDTPMPEAKKDEAQAVAQRAAGGFAGLFADRSLPDKKRLRKTMDAMAAGRCSLDIQWKAMGQSPANGIELCKRLRERYSSVPFVFYSRKITPEDVIDVLQAGATDAIRKNALDQPEVLRRLANAQNLYDRADVESLRTQGFNINITIVPVP